MLNYIKGIHHVSLKCDDTNKYAEAIRFYTECLGLTVYRKWNEGILLSTGNSYIEIFCNGKGTEEKGAVRHFALATDNVDMLADRIKEAGYDVFIEPKDIVLTSEPEVRARIAFCKGPLGEEIELFDEKI